MALISPATVRSPPTVASSVTAKSSVAYKSGALTLAVAVTAVAATFPLKLPVTLPTKSAVTWLNVTSAVVLTSWSISPT